MFVCCLRVFIVLTASVGEKCHCVVSPRVGKQAFDTMHVSGLGNVCYSFDDGEILDNHGNEDVREDKRGENDPYHHEDDRQERLL